MEISTFDEILSRAKVAVRKRQKEKDANWSVSFPDGCSSYEAITEVTYRHVFGSTQLFGRRPFSGVKVNLDAAERAAANSVSDGLPIAPIVAEYVEHETGK